MPDESDDSPSPQESSGPGDAAAFEQVFRRLVTPIARYIDRYVQSKELAAELTQETFLHVWRRLSSAEPQPVQVLEAYVYTTARHVALSALRRRRVEAQYLREHLPPEALEEQRVTAPDAEQAIRSAEVAAALQRAIDELPPRQREVMLLKWRRQATHQEIGAELGIDADTVSVHYRRAILHLRRVLPPLLS